MRDFDYEETLQIAPEGSCFMFYPNIYLYSIVVTPVASVNVITAFPPTLGVPVAVIPATAVFPFAVFQPSSF